MSATDDILDGLQKPMWTAAQRRSDFDTLVIEMMALKLEHSGYCPKHLDRKECTNAPCCYCIQCAFERDVKEYMERKP
jgi:hypothetical protein